MLPGTPSHHAALTTDISAGWMQATEMRSSPHCNAPWYTSSLDSCIIVLQHTQLSIRRLPWALLFREGCDDRWEMATSHCHKISTSLKIQWLEAADKQAHVYTRPVSGSLTCSSCTANWGHKWLLRHPGEWRDSAPSPGRWNSRSTFWSSMGMHKVWTLPVSMATTSLQCPKSGHYQSPTVTIQMYAQAVGTSWTILI